MLLRRKEQEGELDLKQYQQDSGDLILKIIYIY